LMRRAPALARDLALLRTIHGGEAAIAAARAAGIGRRITAARAFTRAARRAPTLIGDLSLPLPIRAEAALLVIRSDRHSRSSLYGGPLWPVPRSPNLRVLRSLRCGPQGAFPMRVDVQTADPSV